MREEWEVGAGHSISWIGMQNHKPHKFYYIKYGIRPRRGIGALFQSNIKSEWNFSYHLLNHNDISSLKMHFLRKEEINRKK